MKMQAVAARSVTRPLRAVLILIPDPSVDFFRNRLRQIVTKPKGSDEIVREMLPPPALLGGLFENPYSMDNPVGRGTEVHSRGGSPPTDLTRYLHPLPREVIMSIQAAEVELDVPINDETGEPFLYTMEIGERTVYADTNEELVAAILGEDYLDEDDPETAFEVRLEGAITIATAIQESIVASAV